MYNDLISVIVPIYDVELYLEKCINSIINQSYRNIEIILVDDESPDGCGIICDRYRELDSRIKVIHKKNGGLSDARNAGLNIANGTYVLFVDSDDYIEKGLIEACYKNIIENDIDLVCFNYSNVNSNGEIISESILNINDGIYDINKIGIDRYIIEKIYTYEHGIEAWDRFYKMSIIKKNNLKFTFNNEIFAEDLLFNLSYLIHVNGIGTISKSYYNYLIRESSIMGKPKKDLFKRYENLFGNLEEYWNKYNNNVVEIIPLGYFIWLISTIKIKLRESNRDCVINEFKEVAMSKYFKKVRNKILEGKLIFNYIKICPNRKKHAILIYVIAFLSLIKNEKLVVMIIAKYFSKEINYDK